MEWAFPTRTFTRMGLHGGGEGSTGVDEAFASRWADGIGVEIMGRNKFEPRHGLEGLEQRFEVEATPSPSGVVHLTFSRRPRGDDQS